MSHDPSEISLVLFHAAAEPELVALYHQGQLASYGRHGATAAAERTRDCDPEVVHMVAAFGPGMEILAGMRIHQRRPDQPLPVELALGDRCPISAAIDARRPAPVVEMSGLWVAEAHRQGPLAGAVTRTALAACRHLGARSVVGCVHQHVLPFYQRYGAVVETSLGVHPYPSPRYATQVVFSDLMTRDGVVAAEQAPLERVTQNLEHAHGMPLALAC
jgi:hypothetical protein